MNSLFKKGYILGESASYISPSKCISENYDLALLASSWDKRCISISEAKFKSKTTLLLEFKNKDSLGLRDEHDVRLKKFLSEITDCNSYILEGSSNEINSLWSDILNRILDSHQDKGKPLDILCDLTACPRMFSLAMLGTCIKSGLAKSITYFYAEGDYSNNSKIETIFTTGEWELVNIPSFEGENYPGRKNAYLVSVGFEGNRILQVLSKTDPDRVSALFPNPGTKPEYVPKARELNMELFEYYKIPDDHIIDAHAADAVSAWASVDKFSSTENGIFDLSYLCCGTKPHALALGLDALCKHDPKLLYRIPDSYKVSSTRPNGTYWKYIIRDLSAF